MKQEVNFTSRFSPTSHLPIDLISDQTLTMRRGGGGSSCWVGKTADIKEWSQGSGFSQNWRWSAGKPRRRIARASMFHLPPLASSTQHQASSHSLVCGHGSIGWAGRWRSPSWQSPHTNGLCSHCLLRDFPTALVLPCIFGSQNWCGSSTAVLGRETGWWWSIHSEVKEGSNGLARLTEVKQGGNRVAGLTAFVWGGRCWFES